MLAVNLLTVLPALFEAASVGDAKAVKSLLAAEADPDAVVGTGSNPLYEATKAGHYEVVHMLLARDATAYLGLAEALPESALSQATIRQDFGMINALLRRTICMQCKSDPRQLQLFQMVRCVFSSHLVAMSLSASKFAQIMAATNSRQFEELMGTIQDPMCPMLRPAVSVLVLNCMDKESCVLDHPQFAIDGHYAEYRRRLRAVKNAWITRDCCPRYGNLVGIGDLDWIDWIDWITETEMASVPHASARNGPQCLDKPLDCALHRRMGSLRVKLLKSR